MEIYESWDKFARALRDDLSGATCSSLSELVLFIHGYNVSFKSAVTSAAQLTYDTSIRAGGQSTPARYRTALAFDWASRAALHGYFFDLRRAEASAPKLLDLLQQLTQVGHSLLYMGPHCDGECNRRCSRACLFSAGSIFGIPAWP